MQSADGLARSERARTAVARANQTSHLYLSKRAETKREHEGFPGTGHLLATGTARPHEILAVTFTNKAAREMKRRVGQMMGEAVEGMPWLGTFHSVCAKLLRRHAELVGLKSNFTILDTDDQLRLLKQLIVAEGIDEKRWPPRMLSGIIDGWKNKALTPDNIPVAESGAFDHRGVDLYAAYQTRLKDLNAVDFGDILLHMVVIFQQNDDVLRLPYRVIGGPRFYERMEIRDAMAYFRLAVSQDDDLAFERIVNTPKRGLGDKAVQTIQMTARENGVNLVEGARICVQEKRLKGKGFKELEILVMGLDRWHAQVMAEADTHVELAEMILDESGYTGFWQNDKTPEAPGRLENLKELVKALENFENLQGFLEHVSLIMDNETEEQGEKVSIMTLHAAKGLEFPAVFLPGWEDGLFPSQRSMDESGLKGLEEERRLAYVGITRAEEICTISFAANRRVYGQWQSAMPSRFIDELPEAHVEVLTPPGLYGGGFGAAGMAATASPAAQTAMGSDLHQKAADANVYNSPGWRRLQARGQQRGMSMPSEARNVTIDLDAVSAFTTGDRVFHQKFGYGEVMAIEGDKLEIEFDKAGSKHVVARFVVNAAQADDVPF